VHLIENHHVTKAINAIWAVSKPGQRSDEFPKTVSGKVASRFRGETWNMDIFDGREASTAVARTRNSSGCPK
jgi:hypothetical protein